MARVRANNYDVPSTVPPDNPSRRVDVIDMDAEMAKVCTDAVLTEVKECLDPSLVSML